MSWCRLRLLTCGLLTVLASINTARGQILSAVFSQCTTGASPAPWEQLINISSVYAQLDLSTRPARSHSSVNASVDFPDGQAILRLVASADTAARSEGFSNVTYYLATLIVEASILSFIPYSNQSALCAAVLTSNSPTGRIDSTTVNSTTASISASSYPSPGGCPYGPGRLLIGHAIPLSSLHSSSYWPLSTVNVRMRILDTSLPALQLACVDVVVSPYYFDGLKTTAPTGPGATSEKAGSAASSPFINDPSRYVLDTVLWLPVATFVTYVMLQIGSRLYAAVTATRSEREAALAASFAQAAGPVTWTTRVSEVIAELATGRSIVRSRSLARFVTPTAGDILAYLQWIVLIGMCSVLWEGYNYTLFARLAWSMLIFDTRIVTPQEMHPYALNSSTDYPPTPFTYNTPDLFTSNSSPFFFSQAQPVANLLNLPFTARYNHTVASAFANVPTAASPEAQGVASLGIMLGLRPQDLFANALAWFAIVLSSALLAFVVLPFTTMLLSHLTGITSDSSRSSPNMKGAMDDFNADGNVTSPTWNTAEPQTPVTPIGQSQMRSLLRPFVGNLAGDDQGSFNSAELVKSGHYAAGTDYFRGDGTRKAHERARTISTGSRHRQTPFGHGIHRWWATATDRSAKRATDSAQPHLSPVRRLIANWSAFGCGCFARLVLWFHLPITTLCVYQLAHVSSGSSTVTVVFAVMVFLGLCLLYPMYLVLRIRKTMTRYLQDDTRTLLAFGPMYNTYASDSYTFSAVRFTANLIEGCAVGGGQRNATVQAAIILIVEVIETLITSIWLPWSDGAAQGPLQFILSVARIITAVLLVVISPAVTISIVARGWITYVIVILQAVIILLLATVACVKILELILRCTLGIEFDESRNPRAGGLLGVFRKRKMLGFGRRGSLSRGNTRRRKGTTEVMRHETTSDHRPSAVTHTPETSQAHHTGYLDPYRQPYFNPREDDLEDEHIMSAWHDGTIHTNGTPARANRIAPGSYAAPLATSGFTKIRGGRATDTNPYTLQSATLPNAASLGIDYGLPVQPPQMSLPAQAAGPERPRRGRAASQSAIVEYYDEHEATPPAATTPVVARSIQSQQDAASRRQSAPMPLSPALPSPEARRRPVSGGNTAWKRTSSVGSAFFSNLFKSTSKSQEGHEEDDWSESSDEEGDSRKNTRARRWPFTAMRSRRSEAEALALGAIRPPPDNDTPLSYRNEDEAWQYETGQSPHHAEPPPSQIDSATPGKSFVVIRQPRPPRRPS